MIEEEANLSLTLTPTLNGKFQSGDGPLGLPDGVILIEM